MQHGKAHYTLKLLSLQAHWPVWHAKVGLPEHGISMPAWQGGLELVLKQGWAVVQANIGSLVTLRRQFGGQVAIPAAQIEHGIPRQ